LLRSVLPRSESFDSTFARNFYSPMFQGHRGSYVAAMEKIASRLANLKHLSSEHFASIVADASFTARVAGLTAQNPPNQDESVDEALKLRLQLELKAERDGRITATKLAEAEAVRAAAATAHAEEQTRAAQTATIRVDELSRNLAKTQEALVIAEREVNTIQMRQQRRKEFLRKLPRLGVGWLILLSPIVLWIWFVEGWSVRGTPLNAVAATVGLGAVGLCVLLPRRVALIGFISTVLFAMLQVAPWTSASTPQAASHETTR
jgi:hypothetical protein